MNYERHETECYVVIDFPSVPPFCQECAIREWNLPLGKRRVVSYARRDDTLFPCEIETARIYDATPDIADLKVTYTDQEGEHESLVCSAFLSEMNRNNFSRKTIRIGEDW